MVNGVGMNGLDQGDVIHNFGRVSQEGTHPAAALSVLCKRVLGWCDGKFGLTTGHRGNAIAEKILRKIFVKLLYQFRLVIPCIELGGPAIHVKIDHRLGPRWKVGQLWKRGMDPLFVSLALQFPGHQRGHRQATQANTDAAKKLASCLQ